MSKYKRADEIFECVKVYMPKKTVKMLKDKRMSTSTPLSRLVAIAVDNELDMERPFNYPCDIPKEVKEYMYASEAGRLLTFLTRVPSGVALETIMLCRREIGVMDRDALMCAMRELYDKELIEQIDVKGNTRVRAKGIPSKVINKRRFRRIEDENLKSKRVITDDEVEG